MNTVQLDKYAKDARTWWDFAKMDYRASMTLFGSGNPFLYFAAATLGHHALEMYLKAALINTGMTIFNPAKLKALDPGAGLAESDCAWGHVLVDLAELLAGRRNDFDLTGKLDLPYLVTITTPQTVREGFVLFDPFFSELRYPQTLQNVQGIGEEEQFVLDRLVTLLEPFASGAL
jgi:hypothetical protein